jgi:hypothetical protein
LISRLPDARWAVRTSYDPRAHRGLDDAGATALTRRSYVANSTTSDFVADCRPPLVSEASAEGTFAVRVVDQTGRHLHDVGALVLAQHLCDGQVRGATKPVRLTPKAAK